MERRWTCSSNREVFPVLTPLAVDPGHPFPYISNLSLSLAVEIRDPDRGIDHFARVKVPKSLPRWVAFGRVNHFVPLEQVIGANLGALFPGMQILGWCAFRVTRYSDLELDKTVDEPEDLLAMIEEQVFQRRFGEVVRLEVQDGMPPHIRALLLEELRESETLPGIVAHRARRLRRRFAPGARRPDVDRNARHARAARLRRSYQRVTGGRCATRRARSST